MENKIQVKNLWIFVLIVLLLGGVTYFVFQQGQSSIDNRPIIQKINRFSSEKQFIDAFKNFSNHQTYYSNGGTDMLMGAFAGAPKGPSHSTTNIQVEGVDEADIIKTDGNYIYSIIGEKLVIAKAYPPEKAKILTTINFSQEESPQEIFIHKDHLLLFSTAYGDLTNKETHGSNARMPFYFGSTILIVRIYDISNREKPKLIRTSKFEGNYLTSRKIDSNVYFVFQKYPGYIEKANISYKEIVPLYTDSRQGIKAEPIAKPIDIGYIDKPDRFNSLIAVVGISISDEKKPIEKEVVAGVGGIIYASKKNLYIAQPSWIKPETTILKFALKNGKIAFNAKGRVKGSPLNQFSMDEYGGYLRIATHEEAYSYPIEPLNTQNNKTQKPTNNLYVLNDNMKVVGKLEDIAKGENLYAARFMGKRAYLITFKYIDPLFVVDLSNPKNPKIMGKLKIPGYSTYLQPYDENHLIGIGNEVNESIDRDKVHDENTLYYTAVRGVKISLFDVSNIKHPVEMDKEVIGGMGSYSPALFDHKSLLFDKEKGILVLPVVVYETNENNNKQGSMAWPKQTFSGVYVYDINLKIGLKLRGKISHKLPESNETNQESMPYYGIVAPQILRSLYIEDALYTLSDSQLQINDLNTLKKIKSFYVPYPSYNYDKYFEPAFS